MPDPLPTGGILGRVRLVDVHHAYDCDTGDDEQGHGPYCSPWAEPGQYHWVLADRLPLAHLQPCRGRLGLWTPFPTATEGQAS